MKKYLLSLSILVVLLAVVIFIVTASMEAWKEKISGYLLVYFTLTTAISHFGLEKATRSRPQVFVRYYMASTSMRLLAHLIVIVLYCIFNPPNAWFFIITFMIMYFVFTIFEVIYVMKYMKNKS
jgi:hypothetical protein